MLRYKTRLSGDLLSQKALAITALLLTAFLGWTPSVFAQQSHSAQEKSPRVATTLPVTYLITRSLLANTPMTVDYLPAKRYPVSRLSYWINQKLPQQISQLPHYAASITVASVWPQHNFYPQLRQQNIRIVPVDAAMQLKPQGAKVSLTARQGTEQDYFWLAPDNLKVMNRIIAEDLSLLWPDYSSQIRRNEHDNDQSISRFQLALDDTLWQQEWEGLCSKQEELKPLLLSLSLPVIAVAGDSTIDSPTMDSSALDGSAIDNPAVNGMRCLWVTDEKSKTEPSAETPSISPQWTLNSLKRYYDKDLNSWLQHNLEQLNQLSN